MRADLGDMAIGFAAPWMILRLARQSDFAASAAFIRWNWLGILDLVVALGLDASMAIAAPGTISTASMATLPLLLVPVFLVPLFLMLHAATLMQGRRMFRGLVPPESGPRTWVESAARASGGLGAIQCRKRRGIPLAGREVCGQSTGCRHAPPKARPDDDRCIEMLYTFWKFIATAP